MLRLINLITGAGSAKRHLGRLIFEQFAFPLHIHIHGDEKFNFLLEIFTLGDSFANYITPHEGIHQVEKKIFVIWEGFSN